MFAIFPQIVFPSFPTDSNLPNVSTDADQNGNVTNKSVIKDGTAENTSYTYNTDGTIKTETDPDGSVTTYNYDSNGNMLTATTVKNSSTTSTSICTYNAIGWELSKNVTVDGNTSSVITDYDSDGSVTDVSQEHPQKPFYST